MTMARRSILRSPNHVLAPALVTIPYWQKMRDLEFLQAIDPHVLRAAVRFKTTAQVFAVERTPILFPQNHRRTWALKPALKAPRAAADNVRDANNGTRKANSGNAVFYSDHHGIGNDAGQGRPRLIRFRRTVKIGWTWLEEGRHQKRLRQTFDPGYNMRWADLKQEFRSGLVPWTEEDEIARQNKHANAGRTNRRARLAELRMAQTGGEAIRKHVDVQDPEDISKAREFEDVPNFVPVNIPGVKYVDEDGFMRYDTGTAEDDHSGDNLGDHSVADKILAMYDVDDMTLHEDEATNNGDEDVDDSDAYLDEEESLDSESDYDSYESDEWFDDEDDEDPEENRVPATWHERIRDGPEAASKASRDGGKPFDNECRERAGFQTRLIVAEDQGGDIVDYDSEEEEYRQELARRKMRPASE